MENPNSVLSAQHNEPIPEEMYPYLRQIARHEYGHWISARLQGFYSDDVTLRLLSLNGDYEATTKIIANQPLADVATIGDFLERRIVTLLCGAAAEADCPEEITPNSIQYVLQQGGGAIDNGKIQELLALHVNIMKSGSQLSDEDAFRAIHVLLTKLTTRAVKLVANEFALIDSLAEQHVKQLQPTTKGWGWGYQGNDIEALPGVQERLARLVVDNSK